MEASRRRGDRSALTRIHGLISLAVRRVRGSLDVRRQRDLADRLDPCIEVAIVLAPEADGPASETEPLQDLAEQHDTAPLETHALAGPQLLTGVHERFPRAVAMGAEQQAFDG